MSEVNPIEAVARAIHNELEGDDDSGGGGYKRAARAALTSLSENITVEMVEAGCKAIENAESPAYDENNLPPFPLAFWQAEARESFRAMLNQAMKEQG